MGAARRWEAHSPLLSGETSAPHPLVASSLAQNRTGVPKTEMLLIETFEVHLMAEDYKRHLAASVEDKTSLKCWKHCHRVV
jgi:hypothetical protein